MMTVTADFRDLIGREYIPSQGVDKNRICWDFCIQAARRLDIMLPCLPQDLIHTDNPEVGSVVLFKYGTAWHCGLLWPDCLHFLHVFPKSPGAGDLYCHLDRLTLPPWRGMVEGFYGVS
jgi:hypothetical protein